MIRRRLNSSFVAALMITVIAGTAFAASAKIKIKQVDVFLPGVNAGGNISFPHGGNGLGKLTFNTKTGRLHVVARGKVTNASKKAQKYKDVGVLPNIGDVIKDDYRVSKKGQAVYQGLAKNI